MDFPFNSFYQAFYLFSELEIVYGKYIVFPYIYIYIYIYIYRKTVYFLSKIVRCLLIYGRYCTY